jgi:hypothetical protein
MVAFSLDLPSIRGMLWGQAKEMRRRVEKMMAIPLAVVPFLIVGGNPSDRLPGIMDGLVYPHTAERHRASSFDRTGGNTDRWRIPAGETVELVRLGSPGIIRHIWITVRADDPDYLRVLRLRAYWDGNTSPAVEAPLGHFFCLGHARVEDVFSLPICVNRAPHVPSPPGQAAFNSFFPMPFHRSARLTVENQGENDIEAFYFSIDFETHSSLDGEIRHFHAAYREELTSPDSDTSTNVGGEGNYVILDATGSGHFVGCNLNVDSRPEDPGKWWEGDDMIWVDGEEWPPRLHGTGTEDYFGSAWGVRRPFCTPFYGVSYFEKGIHEGERYYDGCFTCYRFHLLDPVPFRKSIKVTIEHGHANDAGSRYSSVAYWYQER